MADSHDALVAHLFRRAGFGLSRVDRRHFDLENYADLVEALVTPKIAELEQRSVSTASLATDVLPSDIAIERAQVEWMRWMVSTKAPLLERMTLFFANHFATALSSGVTAVSLVQQHTTIRKHALGNFADLMHAMVDDLALARFLNNDQNSKARPNENFGREVMELFLLGSGNYTERDVKEVARSLTGYTVFHVPPAQRQLVYEEARHDDGLKTVLGVTHAFTPHGVVDLLLAQPTAKRFLARKLVTTFVSPTPDDALVAKVAASLGEWDIKSALRTMFLSPQFRDVAVRHAVPKTPAEYVVGIMRALRRSEFTNAVSHMSAAGHTLFRPPSVAGWPMGKAMLGSGNMLARYNAAASFANLHVKQPAPGAPKGDDLGVWMQEFGITSLSATTQDALRQYRRDTTRQPTTIRTAGMLTLLLSSPEFQLA